VKVEAVTAGFAAMAVRTATMVRSRMIAQIAGDLW
jgi:hypothetical protein